MITPETLARHGRPGPRYTSYPTAVEFTEEFGRSDYEERLRAAATRPEEPLSLYVHLPFCEARCSFCACHVVVTRHHDVADAYLGRVVAETGIVASMLGDRRRLTQLHWGGGTPTYYPPEDLVRLHETLLSHFELDPAVEQAVEVDPRVTTSAHLETLAGLGFNRLSFGVQDFDLEVQRLIGRNQTRQETIRLYERARELGFRSINIDLIHGLPGQDEATMEETLDEVVRLLPDRLAVYGFAYVPWMRPQQRRMDESLFPEPAKKLDLIALVSNRLTDAGYREIGMDHFALPEDDLARAVDDGTLWRNFMGYTTARAPDVIALGTSGISDVDGAYAQDHRRMASYYEAVDAGDLPIERGYLLDGDDLLRREIITTIMCRGSVDLSAPATDHDVDAGEYFAAELGALTGPDGLVEEGLAAVHGVTVSVTDLGRPFVRRLAQVFDTHTGRRGDDRPTFSRVV